VVGGPAVPARSCGLCFGCNLGYDASRDRLHTGIGNPLFAIGVSLTAITLVLDQAVIGLLRSDLKLWRNVLFAGIKLVALFVAGFWFSQRVGLTIYATWAIGNALSTAALIGCAAWRGKWTGSMFLPDWGLLRALSRSALKHHILNLILQGPAMAMPVLVTVLISETTNAWFYISFTLADCCLAPGSCWGYSARATPKGGMVPAYIGAGGFALYHEGGLYSILSYSRSNNARAPPSHCCR
jgi:hypothetical protein